MIKSKRQMYLVIGAFALVLFLGGATYAFFNYTRTGAQNTIRVGRIAFNTTQTSGQAGSINLSNVFPISRTAAATDTDNSGEVVITITGDTDYSEGVEYLITATGLTNTVNGKTVPISVIVTPSSEYYTSRTSAESHIYKVEAGETIGNNERLLVGYIDENNVTIGDGIGCHVTWKGEAYCDFIDIDLGD